MYVTSKHKLPLLAALLLSVSAQAFAANSDPADCSYDATTKAENLCRDQAIMRDYALGLTSETLVHTPPVSLGVTPPRSLREAETAQDEKARDDQAGGPLSLLSGDLLGKGKDSSSPTAGSKAAPVSATARLNAKTPPSPVAKSRPGISKNQAFSTLIDGSSRLGKQTALPGTGAIRRYVALGDFAVPDDATEVAQAFDLWNPRIQHVYIRGRHYRRVLVGPFSDQEIKSVKLHLDQHGFGAAWPLRTTADATPETLIARYPGDG